MAENPREKLEEMIGRGDLEGLLEKATEFHGHYCHKVAYGIKAGLLTLKELGVTVPSREVMGGIVAIVECTGPFCNGVQITTGTLGMSNLIIEDYGKLALTLLKSDGSAVRVILRPEFLDNFTTRNPELAEMFVGKYATIAVPEEEKTPLTQMGLMEFFMRKMGIKEAKELQETMEKMMETHKNAVFKELKVKEEEMFKVERKELDFSKYAPICQCTYPVTKCDSCGELVFEPYARVKRGKVVCTQCL